MSSSTSTQRPPAAGSTRTVTIANNVFNGPADASCWVVVQVGAQAAAGSSVAVNVQGNTFNNCWLVFIGAAPSGSLASVSVAVTGNVFSATKWAPWQTAAPPEVTAAFDPLGPCVDSWASECTAGVTFLNWHHVLDSFGTAHAVDVRGNNVAVDMRAAAAAERTRYATFVLWPDRASTVSADAVPKTFTVAENVATVDVALQTGQFLSVPRLAITWAAAVQLLVTSNVVTQTQTTTGYIR